jgi:thiol-disulfide isomerase/thioredoxin
MSLPFRPAKFLKYPKSSSMIDETAKRKELRQVLIAGATGFIGQRTRNLGVWVLLFVTALATSRCGSHATAATPSGSAQSALLRASTSSATLERAPIEPVIATGLLDLRQRQVAPGKRWILINIWATWCEPCREEYVGFLARTARNFVAAGGEFAAVAFDEDSALPKARLFMASLGLPPNTLLYVSSDGPHTKALAAIGFDGDSIPYTALVSPAGEVKWRYKGEIREQQLLSAIRSVTGFKIPPREH